MRRLRILVADDERDQAMTLALLLADEGHDVREVHRGSEVLRVVRDFDPDVATRRARSGRCSAARGRSSSR
jgi:PleD family two-component response regulator